MSHDFLSQTMSQVPISRYVLLVCLVWIRPALESPAKSLHWFIRLRYQGILGRMRQRSSEPAVQLSSHERLNRAGRQFHRSRSYSGWALKVSMVIRQPPSVVVVTSSLRSKSVVLSAWISNPVLPLESSLANSVPAVPKLFPYAEPHPPFNVYSDIHVLASQDNGGWLAHPHPQVRGFCQCPRSGCPATKALKCSLVRA